MATLRLEHIKKIYPYETKREKKKKNEDELEKSANLQITEEGVVAVQDFNIEIKDREFIVLVGSSGCGKTTTLRMIAGLEEITDGDLYLDDKWLNNTPAKDRNMAMVFQSYALYPHMTVAQNIGFPLKIAKVDKKEIERRVNEVAEILEVKELLDRKPRALSGGQRQRVAIARAIVREPKVLLMDEPLSNLDAKLRNQTRAEIIKLRSKIDATFVYVTHDQTEAMTLGDRIVVMKDGFIQQIGTPSEVFSHPANLFVAEFIGSPQMNRIEDATLIKNGKNYSVKLFNQEFKLTKQQSETLANKNIDSMDVVVGVRPAHIAIGEGNVKAEIIISELLGTDVHMHAMVDGKEIVIVAPTAKYEQSNGKNGAMINIDIDVNNIHIFDKVTTNSIL